MKDTDLVLGGNPFGLLRRFTRDIERLFDEAAFPPFAFSELKPGRVQWMPNVDVFEKDGKLVVRADLPGLTKKDVNIEITDEMLTISGERKTEFEEKKEGVYRQERTYGSFYRAFPLPAQVKPEEIKATFADGVLEVTMPLPAAKQLPKPRHVEIQEATPEKSKSAA